MNLAQVFMAGRDRYPNAVALYAAKHSLTHAQAFRDVERIAAHLVHQGLGLGQVVATDIQSPVGHWMMLMALMRIGTVSVTLTDRSADEIAALPDLAAVISGLEDDRPRPPMIRRIRVGKDWLATDPDRTAALPAPEEAAQTLGRICFTSGTTGQPKAILLDADRLSTRLSATSARSLINTRSVLWCGLGPDTAYGFTATIAAWLEGASVVFARGGIGACQILADQHVNLMIASPAALAPLLREASAAGLAALPRVVIVGGGRLSVDLRDAALQHLCTQVFVAYGSSETGGITLDNADGLDRHPGHVGAIFADVEARIVSEIGVPIMGSGTGFLQVRAPSSVTAYLNAPAETVAHFEDGWFQPGDVAAISDKRVLTLLGRPSDVLNFGGVKLAAGEIDAVAREHPGIEDACAIALPSAIGAQLVILVVATGDITDLAAHVRKRLPEVPRFGLIAGPIPRGSMGKVNRQHLADLIGASLAGTDGIYSRLSGSF